MTETTLGKIIAVGGTTATIRLNAMLSDGAATPSQSAATRAAVGSLVKIKADNLMLFGSIGRIAPDGQSIDAEISFIGEGLVGATGVGKSTSVAQLLHKILAAAPNGHVVLIDPHGEYASAFKGNSIHLDVEALKLPFWLMNFEEHAEAFLTGEGSSRERDRDILGKCLLTVRQKNYLNIQIDKVTADSPIPYFISDMLEELEKEAGKLEKAADASRYIRLKLKIEEVCRDPRYAFMFGDRLMDDSMAEMLSTILRIPTEGKPLTIIDVSGMPSEIVSVVVAMIARLVFDCDAVASST